MMRDHLGALLRVSWLDQFRSPTTRTALFVVPILSVVVWYLPDRFTDRYPLKLAWAHPLAGFVALLMGVRCFAERRGSLFGLANHRYLLGKQQTALDQVQVDLLFPIGLLLVLIPLVGLHLVLGHVLTHGEAEVTVTPRWGITTLAGAWIRIVSYWTILASGAFAVARSTGHGFGKFCGLGVYIALLIAIPWWIEGDVMKAPLEQPSTRSCLVALLLAGGLHILGSTLRPLSSSPQMR